LAETSSKKCDSLVQQLAEGAENLRNVQQAETDKMEAPSVESAETKSLSKVGSTFLRSLCS